MKRLYFIFFVIFFNILTNAEYLAILEFDNFNMDDYQVKLVQNRFIYHFSQIKKYSIIERTQVDQILKEQSLVKCLWIMRKPIWKIDKSR